jgi:hypothetical protein
MTLVCIECGKTSEDGEGWKAELAVMLLDKYDGVEREDVEPEEVTVYCPTCWSREFGDA